MKDIEIINSPLAGTLTVGDDPINYDGPLRVYELISNYEYIEKSANGNFKSRYKHVAVTDSDLFIYDLSENKTVGFLGPYRAYSIVSDEKGVRLVEASV